MMENVIDDIMGRDVTALSPTAMDFEDAFLAPEPRDGQEEIVETGVKKLNGGADVYVVDAPPGIGKSLALSAIPRRMGASAFYVTPLNTLVDQLDSDRFLEDALMTIKGRNNYDCILPDASPSTTVDKGKCQKEPDFDCPIKDDCPYYDAKDRALRAPFVVTNMSYLMADSMIPETVDNTFGNRDVLIVDECQNIEDFAMSFISFTVSERTVPDRVWEEIELPDERYEEDLEYIFDWVEGTLLEACKNERERLETLPFLEDAQLDDMETIRNFIRRIENFLEDAANNDWVVDVKTEINKNAENDEKVVFEPVEVGRFLKNLIWNRADNIILASATVPKGGWIDEIGLGDKDVAYKNVGSPFPVDNRPIVTGHAVGKMTSGKRKQNAPEMVAKIKEIVEHHEGEKGIVHCRSYGIRDLLKRTFVNRGLRDWFKEHVMMQDRNDRMGSLEDWMQSDVPLFLSVNMAEGVSLDGELAEYQILAKALYKNLGNKRVSYRVQERNEWNWYNRHAVIQIEQAYGRAVRSEEDEAVFYILDSSAIDLMQRSTGLFHDWFLEGVTDLDL